MRYKTLDVYRCSIEFLAIAWKIVEKMPRGHGDLSNQLKRASTSIPLNIAEGSGRSTPADCARHYAISRGSAMECSAILDVMRVLKTADPGELEKGQEFLHRVVSMLTKMGSQ